MHEAHAAILNKAIDKLAALNTELMDSISLQDVDKLDQLSKERDVIINIIRSLKKTTNPNLMLESNLNALQRDQEFILIQLFELKKTMRSELDQIRKTKRNISKYNLSNLK